MFWAVVRYTVAIVMAASTALFLSFDVIGLKETESGDSPPWQIYALSSFIVLVFIVGYQWIRLERRVITLQGARPTPKLTIDKHPTSERVRLRLENSGGAAEFTAKAITDEDQDAYWNIRWRGARGKGRKINTGDHELLDIAEPVGTFKDFDSDNERQNQVVFYTPPNYEGHHIQEQSLFTLPMPENGLHIHIQITADPPMHPNAVLEKDYLLKRQGTQLIMENVI